VLYKLEGKRDGKDAKLELLEDGFQRKRG